MKNLFLLIAMVVFSCALVAHKKADVEGDYLLDKIAMKAIVEAHLANMEPRKRKLAMPYFLGMVDVLNVHLCLRVDGQFAMNTQMPNFFRKGEISKRTEVGAWKIDGTKIVLVLTTYESVKDRAKIKRKKESITHCELDGKKLTCLRQGQKHRLVFAKISAKELLKKDNNPIK